MSNVFVLMVDSSGVLYQNSIGKMDCMSLFRIRLVYMFWFICGVYVKKFYECLFFSTAVLKYSRPCICSVTLE